MYDYERRRLVAIINKDVAGAVQEEMRKAIAYAQAFIKDAEKAVSRMSKEDPSTVLDELEEAANKLDDRIAYARQHLGHKKWA